MALILNIETATKNCSVSIAKNGELIGIRELNDQNYSHAEKLHPFIKELFDEFNITPIELDAIAVSKGPGSYTGLRIGVSTAKGLCFALNKPLIAIDTLESLANTITVTKGNLIVPMLDARRMEVYTAIYNDMHQKMTEITARIIDENSFLEQLENSKIYFIGDGSQKCKETIKHPNAQFIEDKMTSSKEMCQLSYNKYKNKEFEDVAYFEPFYLKDFIAIPAKKKI